MRWVILIILASLTVLFTVPQVSAALNPWGCCVPPTGKCFDGNAWTAGQQTEFAAACTAAQGTIKAIPATTCGSVSDCDQGCCCAQPNVPGAPAINTDETLLNITRNACTKKTTASETYVFTKTSAIAPKKTCVEFCGGTTPPVGGTTHTVSGVVQDTASKPIKGAQIFAPVYGGYIQTTSNTNGVWQLTNVPEITLPIFAVNQSCRPFGPYNAGVVNKDLTGIKLTLTCNIGACVHKKPTLTGLALVKGTDKMSFTGKVADDCLDFSQFETIVCDKNWQGCQNWGPSKDPSITLGGLEAGKTYCVNLTARFTDGTLTSADKSSSACITEGDADCMNLAPDATSWCGKAPTGVPAAVTCDDNNKLKVLSACTSDQFCTIGADGPVCVAAPDCTKCNGLVGLFAKLGLTIRVGSGASAKDLKCGTTQIPSCFNDAATISQPVMIDEYRSCKDISACEEYHSKTACTNNACTAGGSKTACSWKDINLELGTGVCITTAKPACEKCEDAFGYCNKEACSAISSQCYYDGVGNGLAPQGCISNASMACRYYDTKADCVGTGSNAAFSIVYNTTGARMGDTHIRTTASKDALSIGSCTWNDLGWCYKDADMKHNTDPALANDDCVEDNRFDNDPACVRDTTPPRTQFFITIGDPTNPPIYSKIALKTLPYAVYDTQSPLDKIKTYVCFYNSSQQPCYPTDTKDNIYTFANLKLPATEGQHWMRYYSVDANHNFEVINTIGPIQVKDYGQATLDTVTLEENN